MAKKILKKTLMNAGGTVAIALAMASVVSLQANAAEVDENLLGDINTGNADMESTTGANEEMALIESNDDIDAANAEIISKNEETVEENGQIEENNNTAADANEEMTDGALENPDLSMPEAPQAPDTEGMDTEEYNEAIGEYNGAVDDYNEAADKYNEDVDAYNASADAVDQNAMEQFEEDQRKQSEDEEAAFKDAEEEYEDKLEEYEDYLEAQEEYEAAEKAHETESAIYDEVSGYNEKVELDNAQIELENAALGEDLHAGTAENIEAVGEINENVEVPDAIMAVLEGYEALIEAQNALEAKAAALNADERRNAALSSAEYAAYLAEVEAFNEEVKAHNENIAAYNEAVGAYNEAVDAYNESRESGLGTTTSEYDQGTADWGNINIDGHTVGHLDVKYNAAVSRDSTVQPDGSVTYTDSVTKYEVDGVYTAEDSIGDGYALKYRSDSDDAYSVQNLKKQNYEFRIADEGKQKEITLKPETGEVTFYMTVVDKTAEDTSENVQGFTVKLDASSTYADGTYFKPVDVDNLQYFRFGEKLDQKLPTVIIDGETYYDISGQSVFVISALACNGASYGRGNTVNPDGLDLVLNLQTLIKLHQEDNAQKITYLNFQKGMTAQAEDPGEFDMEEPDPVDPPGDRPTREDFDKEPLTEPTPVARLEHVERLEKLTEKLVIVIPEEEPETPPVWFNDDVIIEDEIDIIEQGDGFVQIPDEEVPLADAPKTGDVSLLWAVISGLSAGGMFMLRKRKDAE